LPIKALIVVFESPKDRPTPHPAARFRGPAHRTCA